MSYVVDYASKEVVFEGSHPDCNKWILKQSILKKGQYSYDDRILPTIYKIYNNRISLPRRNKYTVVKFETFIN